MDNSCGPLLSAYSPCPRQVGLTHAHCHFSIIANAHQFYESLLALARSDRPPSALKYKLIDTYTLHRSKRAATICSRTTTHELFYYYILSPLLVIILVIQRGVQDNNTEIRLGSLIDTLFLFFFSLCLCLCLCLLSLATKKRTLTF